MRAIVQISRATRKIFKIALKISMKEREREREKKDSLYQIKYYYNKNIYN